MTEVRTITTAELDELVGKGGTVQLWNVLTDEYFRGEMIPGSRRVPLDRVGREAGEAGLAKTDEVVVYCAGPGCPQSGLAARKLRELGYRNVRAYEGGLEEWKGLGRLVDYVGEPVGA